ncbi:MAG TPA: hypothetical protein ENN07_07425 [candidate division Zixibacteria bacterium]|nr:hypothetical protein [candidate division Zixibacteria bacterium]
MSRRFSFVVIGLILLALSAFGARGLSFVSTLKGFVAGDRFGVTIEPVGDVNGDGFVDFIIGAPGSYQASNYSGKAYLYFGGTDPSKPALELTGEKPGDRFGASVTALGDISGNGFGDFAIGAPRNDDGGVDAGKVYIYYGGKELSGAPDMVLTGERSNDWFGTSLAGGKDLNGDNVPDLLVGASYGGANHAGVVYVFFGGSNFGTPALVLNGESAGDGFGEKIAIFGDVSGNGVSDFGVSAYYHNSSGLRNAGKVYLYQGGSIIDKKPWHQIEGKRPQANFGFALTALGDVNGDGVPDIGIGAPGDGPNGEGVAYIYAGAPVIRDPFASIYGQNSKDLYGYSICAGDVNGDQFADILIGTPFADIGSYRSGRVEIFYGGEKLGPMNNLHINGNFADAQCGTVVAFVPNFYGRRGGLFLVSSPGPLANGGTSFVHVYK